MSVTDMRLALALRCHRQGNLAQAESLYREILAQDDGDADARHLLGVVHFQSGHWGSAISELRRALEAHPDNPVFHCRLGLALAAAGDDQAALGHYRRAIALDPGYAEAHNNLGICLADGGDDGAACAAYRAAIGLKADFAEAHNNLGVALRSVGDLDGAVAAHEQAIALVPDYAEAHKNLGLAHLLEGRFGEGFDTYEWRWREPGAVALARAAPPWQGEDLRGKHILVWGEQGIGDQVMFASMLGEVAAAAERCVVECDRRLIPLFARSFPNLAFTDRGDVGADVEVDFHSSFGSLCRWLRRDAGRFARRQAYLEADQAKVAAARARYARLGSGPLIGIAWQSLLHDGSPRRRRHAASKSTQLAAWAPVLRACEAVFVSLQYGDCASEIAEIGKRLGVTVHRDPCVDQLKSIDDYAAQVAAMDLVITTSNTTAHTAGALGRPVWTLLNHVPDWRWQRAGTESLWYPRMRLFRQSTAGDWASVFSEAAEILRGGIIEP